MNMITKFGFAVLGSLVALSSNVMAADPTWFTDLTTSMTAISVMAGTALAAVITVKLVPLAWRYIAPIIGRG